MSKAKQLEGQRFGRLVVIERAGSRAYGEFQRHALWLCQCDCGNTHITTSRNLLSGGTRSCGCLRKENGRKTGVAQKGKTWKQKS
jgi:hypothetical protein